MTARTFLIRDGDELDLTVAYEIDGSEVLIEAVWTEPDLIDITDDLDQCEVEQLEAKVWMEHCSMESFIEDR